MASLVLDHVWPNVSRFRLPEPSVHTDAFLFAHNFALQVPSLHVNGLTLRAKYRTYTT